MILKELYKHDPILHVGLTSRGTWTVTAGKYAVATDSWEERISHYKDHKWLIWKRPYLQQYEISREVENAIKWLLND